MQRYHDGRRMGTQKRQDALFRVAQWQAIPREVALGPLAEERRYDGLAMDEVTSCDWTELARGGKAR